MKSSIALLTIFLLFIVLNFVHADTTSSRPDSHAPIGVMGDHGHKSGEVMLSYRFMAIDMQGLQSGTTPLETTDVLKNFMITPTQMGMRMHTIGAMFAPHDRITLMAMTGYQQHNMKMEGAHHHTEGHHEHPVGTHEMSSAGIGDVKLEFLLTLWKIDHLNLIGNIGVSLPKSGVSYPAPETIQASAVMKRLTGSLVSINSRGQRHRLVRRTGCNRVGEAHP